MHSLHRPHRLAGVVALLVFLAACSAQDNNPESSAAGDASSSTASATSSAQSAALAPADIPMLSPSASFTLADDERVQGVAMAPDGSRIIVKTQARLGAPVTLRSYDATTGAAGPSVTINSVGLWTLHWMADNRLVAADRDAQLRWRVWDGTTLEAQTPLPQDATCADGIADRTTGAIYSTNGISAMGDVICRFDTNDGSITRTANGLLRNPDGYWVRPGSDELVVQHARGEELLTLDGKTLERTAATPLEAGESIAAVGKRLWMSNGITRTSHLEPGDIAVPDINKLHTSTAGTYFLHSDGMDDFVIYAANDGQAVGRMPAGMNPAGFSDWSINDSAFVRLTIDGSVEIYSF